MELNRLRRRGEEAKKRVMSFLFGARSTTMATIISEKNFYVYSDHSMCVGLMAKKSYSLLFFLKLEMNKAATR